MRTSGLSYEIFQKSVKIACSRASCKGLLTSGKCGIFGESFFTNLTQNYQEFRSSVHCVLPTLHHLPPCDKASENLIKCHELVDCCGIFAAVYGPYGYSSGCKCRDLHGPQHVTCLAYVGWGDDANPNVHSNVDVGFFLTSVLFEPKKSSDKFKSKSHDCRSKVAPSSPVYKVP